MYIVLMLGRKEEYLHMVKFDTEKQADDFVEAYYDLVVANIKRDLPLKDRLSLAPEYYPRLGKVVNMYVVDVKQINTGWVKDGNG